MTYDDEVVQRIYGALRPATDEPDKWVRQQSMSAGHAITPLTLKAEDGRFVKVEPVYYADCEDGRLIVDPAQDESVILLESVVYRIVEDPSQ